MKPIWVATLNAGKFNTVFQIVKNSGIVLLMSLFLVIISCDKSDDLETVGNESPIDNESPPDQSPPDETPPDEESPAVNEPPNEDESIIVYTDIEPDFTSENLNDSYDLDLNSDGIIDFTVTSDQYEGYEYLWIASHSNAVNYIISVHQWYYFYIVLLDINMEIFNLRRGESYQTGAILDCWAGDGDQICSTTWKDKYDKYLGFRFIIKGQTHYGWARLDVTSVTQWVIKDYAYNATPNKPILAGQRE